MSVALADFFALLEVEEASFYLPGTRSFSRTEGGTVLTSVTGVPLWRGTVTMAWDDHQGMAAQQALVERADYDGAPFLIHPVPLWTPASDPGGTVQAATPRLHSVGANPRSIRITGLPPGYALTRGDLLSFAVGGIHHLHRVMGPTVASPAGLTPWFDVVPPVLPGSGADPATGPVVTLVKPVCAAVIVPGSVRWPRARHQRSEGLAFDFIQTLVP